MNFRNQKKNNLNMGNWSNSPESSEFGRISGNRWERNTTTL